MRIKEHFLASSILAIVFYYFTRSLAGTTAAFLAGVLIDLDHLFDFWKSKPNHPFSIKEFLHPCGYMDKNQKIYVPLHSYELLILLWLFWSLNHSHFLLGIALGMTLHLILDDIGNKLQTLSYFFSYRVWKKFRVFLENDK